MSVLMPPLSKGGRERNRTSLSSPHVRCIH